MLIRPPPSLGSRPATRRGLALGPTDPSRPDAARRQLPSRRAAAPGGDGTDLDSPDTLVLVFSGLPEAELELPAKALREAFPRSVLADCSTAGEVIDDTIRDGGISLAVARLERTRLTAASAAVGPGASFRGGAELARQLRAEDLAASGRCELHNQTMTLTTLAERAAERAAE